MNALAKEMDVRQSTASNLVRSLTELEFVDVRRDARDGRAVVLHFEPAGARVAAAPGPFTGVLPQALAGPDTATLRPLEKDLAAVIGHSALTKAAPASR